MIRDESPCLTTLRTQVLVAGAILGADERKGVLRLGLRGPWRERFAAVLQRISELATYLWCSLPATRKTRHPGRETSPSLSQICFSQLGLTEGFGFMLWSLTQSFRESEI